MQADCGASLDFFHGDPRVAKGRQIILRRHPDDDSSTVGQKLDCLVEWADGMRFAIEHTRLEGLPNHLRVESTLDDFAIAVEAITIPNRLVDVELPQGLAEVPKRLRKAAIQQVSSTLRSVLPTLGDGEAMVTIPGHGKIKVELECSDTSGTRLFSWSGDRDAAESYFQASVEKALQHKNPELGQHRSMGFLSVLLLETLDRTRTSQLGIKTAVLNTIKPSQRSSLDEIWSLRGGPRGGYRLDQIL